MSCFEVLALGGDGIGPEVLASGIEVLNAAAKLAGIEVDIKHDLLHGACWDVHGTFCRDETVAAADHADAVLVGAIGGPKWDNIRVAGGAEMQDGLMRLRKELNTYAGLRPARFWPSLSDRTPFSLEHVQGSDILIVRETSGGVLFAEPRGQTMCNGKRFGFDTAAYDEDEIRRISIAGFEMARRRRKNLLSTDKANVMESFKLWREIVNEVALDYPDVNLSHMYADNLAYQLVMDPTRFDVVIACNLLGDILSDLTAVVSGGLGMLPSACLRGPPGGRVKGIYEPVHGSAPDITGLGIANPVGMILSVAMMFEHSFEHPEVAEKIESAVSSSLLDGFRTPDIGGKHSTKSVTESIVNNLVG